MKLKCIKPYKNETNLNAAHFNNHGKKIYSCLFSQFELSLQEYNFTMNNTK